MTREIFVSNIERHATAPQVALLLARWRAFCHEGQLPAFSAYDTPRLGACRDYLCLYAHEEPAGFTEILRGTGLVSLDETVSPALATLAPVYERALHERRPLFVRHGTVVDGRYLGCSEQLVLPLTGPDGIGLVLSFIAPLRNGGALESRILHAAADGIAAFRALRDEQGQIEDFLIIFANATMETLTARKREEVMNRRLCEMFPESRENGVYARYVRLVETQSAERYEALRNDSAFQGWIRVSAAARGDDVTIFVANITEDKQRTQMLEQERTDLMYSTSLLEEQAANLANLVGEIEAARAALADEVARREELERELTRVANTDALTGLPNRHAFTPAASHAFASARRYAMSLSALVIDLDHFKKVNDTYGHSGGDAALRVASQAIARCLRLDVDIHCRFGGEEFVVLLPHTPLDGALVVAERLRSSIAAMRVSDGDHEFGISASIGVAAIEADDTSYEAMLARADAALYLAKKNGRNRCESAIGKASAAA